MERELCSNIDAILNLKSKNNDDKSSLPAVVSVDVAEGTAEVISSLLKEKNNRNDNKNGVIVDLKILVKA